MKQNPISPPPPSGAGERLDALKWLVGLAVLIGTVNACQPISLPRHALSPSLAARQSEPVAQDEPDEQSSPSESASQDEFDWGAVEGDDESVSAADDDSESPGRTFLYKEIVLSGFYSPDGVRNVPPGDESPDHFEFNPRPPGNYLGLDFVHTLTEESWLNRSVFPNGLPLGAVDLHPRLVFDRMEPEGDPHRFKFAPQDFWLRFDPGGSDRWRWRLGQFVIPYGVNPTLAPRQRFILPIEATDLGLKWDWGTALKGPLGDYDWELAATVGSGEALHSTHLFQSNDKTSYLVTGRVGAPNYWDFQYGLSFLYGDLSTIRGATQVFEPALSRWRAGLDAFYKAGTYLMAGAQVTYGQDGFAGDQRFQMISRGRPSDVLGYRGWVDWVVPALIDLRLSAQFESILRDLSVSHSDDTALIAEISYSLTTEVSLMLDYRVELNRAMGGENDAFYLTFVYYGL